MGANSGLDLVKFMLSMNFTYTDGCKILNKHLQEYDCSFCKALSKTCFTSFKIEQFVKYFGVRY